MQKQDQMKKDQGSCSTDAPKTGSCGTDMKKKEQMGSCSSTDSKDKDKNKGGSCS